MIGVKKRGRARIAWFMSAFLLLLSLFAQLLWATPSASAHLKGQPPFFFINNKPPEFYPIQGFNASQFAIPQTNAPEKYRVNQELHFKVDTSLFVDTPQEAINRSKYVMEFGDGQSFEGLNTTHTYTKQGSYLLTVKADDGSGPKVIEGVLLHILPRADYRLPEAKISYNGKTVKGGETYNFGKKEDFSSKPSTAGSAPINRILWDFGNGEGKQGEKVEYSFKDKENVATVVMRVFDQNGFLSDQYMVIGKDTTSWSQDFTNFLRSINENIKRSLSNIFSSPGNHLGPVLVLLGLTLVAGGLHAVTPGHGKSLMAAFLIGRGKNKFGDVVILAGAITITHTIVIFALGALFLLIEAKYSLGDVLPHFERINGVLIVILSLYLLRMGYRRWKHKRAHDHGHEHKHSHSHDHSDNSKKKKALQGRWGLFMAGASGGIVPCVDALSLLMLAAGIGQVGFGLLLVFVFSLGLAATVVLIGAMVLFGHSRIKEDGRLARFAEIYAPILSGVFILILGISLLV